MVTTIVGIAPTKIPQCVVIVRVIPTPIFYARPAFVFPNPKSTIGGMTVLTGATSQTLFGSLTAKDHVAIVVVANSRGPRTSVW